MLPNRDLSDLSEVFLSPYSIVCTKYIYTYASDVGSPSIQATLEPTLDIPTICAVRRMETNTVLRKPRVAIPPVMLPHSQILLRFEWLPPLWEVREYTRGTGAKYYTFKSPHSTRWFRSRKQVVKCYNNNKVHHPLFH